MFQVVWVHNDSETEHGQYETLEGAVQSIFDWWDKHKYQAPYVRQ